MDRTQILTGYVTDMGAVEKHILEAVERQLTNEDTQKYPTAMSSLESLRATLARHVEVLDNYGDGNTRAGVLETVKNAATGALGIAAGFYNQLRQTDTVSRSVRDTYTALGLATISYEMLFTTALALRDEPLAETALRHLGELTPHTVDLSKVVCEVVARELTDEDKTLDPSVGPEAVRRTQEVWRRANRSGGDGANVEAPLPTASSAPGVF